MKQSLTYYITMFVLKLKGIKKDFSQDPIDYKKIRKEDVHRPKGRFFKQSNVRNFQVLKSSITEIKSKENPDNLVILIHGGAFICGPGQHHWDSLRTIVKKTNHTGWMCDYPKAPEAKISEISRNIDAVYYKALESYKSEQITLIGGSVGGTLVTALIQRLNQKKEALPKCIILVSPVMDATMTNPKIKEIEKFDPMLSTNGILSAKKLCAENADLKDEKISPINGSFKGFPKKLIFVAENDIMYPDELLAIQKMQEAQVNVEVIEGKNMPHVWPFLPVMQEAKLALNQIISRIKNS